MDEREIIKKIAMLEKEVKSLKEERFQKKSKEFDRPILSQFNVENNWALGGSITFSQNNYLYRLPAIKGYSEIHFLGAAINTPSGATIRSMVVGQARLQKSAWYQPDQPLQVKLSKDTYPWIQFSTAFTMDGTTRLNTVSENHLVSVNFPTNAAANIKARLTVERLEPDAIYLRATLDTTWSIVGNIIIV